MVKAKVKKKLRREVITITEVRKNLGAELVIRIWPDSLEYQCFFSKIRVQKKDGGYSSLSDWCGQGGTPSKALRNLCKKLSGKTLSPYDGGPCRDGRSEMILLGKVISK